MARRNKRWERDEGRKSTVAERAATFDSWWNEAKNHVDPAMGYWAFHAKWLRCCNEARYADDETPLSAAWKAVTENSLPPEATQQRAEPLQRPMQLLIALCYQLQLAQGTKPFGLGSRDAGRLLGVPHATVFYWLEGLCNPDGFAILKKVKIGSLAENLTNEYLYLRLVNPESPSA